MGMTAAEVLESVREIWLAELGIETAGGEENFFALGGESLGAAAVVDAVNRRLGLGLGLKALYREATLDALTARAIEEFGIPQTASPNMDSGAQAGREPLELNQAQAIAPTPKASLGQEWTLSFSEDPSQEGMESFLVQEAFTLRGRLDIARIQGAVDEIVSRHELLRSTFRRAGGEVYLEAAPSGRTEVEVVDIGPESPRDVLKAAAHRGFDHYAAPAARYSLFRLTPEDHVLLFVFDHIIVDGTSIEILLRDFAEAYAGRDLPPSTIPFTAWAAQQRRLAADADRIREYWHERLGDDPAIVAAPFDDYLRPQAERADGTVLTLSADQATLVRAAARRCQVTVYSMMLGSFLISLRDRVSRRRFCVVTTAANRTAETAHTFGPLAHDVYIPVDLTAQRDLAAAAAYAQENTVESLTHAVVPNTVVAQSLWPRAGAAPYLLPAFYFSANRMWASRFRLGSARSEELRFAPQMPMPGLECTLEHDDRAMRLTLRYLADSFPPGYVRSLGEEAVQRVLESGATPCA